jgi:hypothetical protein
MPFKYTPLNSDTVKFTRLSAGCGRFAFIAIGSIFTLVGFSLIAFGQGIEMPFALIKYIVPIFGLAAIYAGIMLPKIQSQTSPDEIIFDNLNGRVQVNQQHSDINTGYIYYDEIEDFIVKAKKQESGSSKSSRTYYTYHVYLSKKDRGQWELLKFNSEEAARNEIIKLKTLIKLDVQPQRVALNVTQSKKYNITNDYHRTTLSWRNKIGYGPLFLAAFSVLFLTIGYVIVSSGFLNEDFPIFAYFVVGFIGIVFVIVIGGNAIKMIKNANTVYSIEITSASLDYMEKDEAERIKKTVQFPLNDLHAISFSFDTDSTFRKIFIYNHEQFEKQGTMTVKFSVDSIMNMYKFYRDLVSIELQDLTPVEALQVENYIQQQIKERGNVQVA